MTYQKIMAPFFNERSAERSFKAGAILAKRFKAHIDAVHLRQNPPVPTSAYHPFPYAYMPVDVAELEEAAEKLAGDLASLFAKLVDENQITVMADGNHTPSDGATASWTDASGAFPESLSARARICDLIVFAKPDETSPIYEEGVLEEFLFQSGKPVYITSGTETDAPRRVIVGWNGGREAARAIAASMPILQDADDVHVVCVGEPPLDVEPSASVVSYLKLHGVHAKAIDAPMEKGEDADDVFADIITQKNADLVVMGAYSHSRWRELVLGGFTRAMLRQSKVSLLLAH